jgi:hypothetical protein
MESDCTSFAILCRQLLHIFVKCEGFIHCQEVKRDFLRFGSPNPMIMLWKTYCSKDPHLPRGKGAYPEPPLQPSFSLLELLPRTPSLNMRLKCVSLSKWKEGQEEEERVFLLFQFRAARSATGIVSTHQALHSGHIWTQCKELKAWRDRNGAEMVAPVQEVANTVSSNSSK